MVRYDDIPPGEVDLMVIESGCNTNVMGVLWKI